VAAERELAAARSGQEAAQAAVATAQAATGDARQQLNVAQQRLHAAEAKLAEAEAANSTARARFASFLAEQLEAVKPTLHKAGWVLPSAAGGSGGEQQGEVLTGHALAAVMQSLNDPTERLVEGLARLNENGEWSEERMDALLGQEGQDEVTSWLLQAFEQLKRIMVALQVAKRMHEVTAEHASMRGQDELAAAKADVEAAKERVQAAQQTLAEAEAAEKAALAAMQALREAEERYEVTRQLMDDMLSFYLELKAIMEK